MTEYEIDIDDELWEAAKEASGLNDPSEITNLTLREMHERLKAERGHPRDG